MKTQTTNPRTVAALRAHETREWNKVRRERDAIAISVNPIVAKVRDQVLALIDAELAHAPVKPIKVKTPVDRKAAALRAWRTMLQQRVKGLRGKARTDMQQKIADYDRKLAA
jgi:hypothetical protein